MGTLRTDGFVTITDRPLLLWRNILSADRVGDNEEDPDFPASNVANPSTALKWKHDATGSPEDAVEFFLIDVPGSELVNYVAIAGHNFNTANIAVGIEVFTSGSPLGETGIIDPEVPQDDGPIIFLFEEDAGIEGISIILRQGILPAEMAVVYAGRYTQFEEGIQADHTPLPLAVVSDVTSGKSENGAFLGRIVIREGLASVATIANMEEDFVMDEIIDFLAFASEFPFFWVWRPLTYTDQTAFAWLENDPQPTLDIDGYWAVDLSMRGLGA